SAIGSVMIPPMEKSGYPRVFSSNVSISALVQGLLVPPSHYAVIYSLATGGTMSIASRLLAGVKPGLLLGARLRLLCLVLACRWRDLRLLVYRSLRTVAMVMMLIACAAAVGYMMALMQMPAKITAFFLTLSSNKYVILLLINALLLVLGCLVDMAPSILITTPILLPVVMKFGVDPVHFGMIMLMNLGIGLCHPPVGATLFVGCAVGRVRM